MHHLVGCACKDNLILILGYPIFWTHRKVSKCAAPERFVNKFAVRDVS
jgi:hypothetical protein